MSETIADEVLHLLGLWNSEGAGKAVEFGGQIRFDGKTCNLAVSGDGALMAVIFYDEILIRRRRGSAKISLTPEELTAVIPVLACWEQRRHSLTYLDSSSAGFPAGRGGAWYYRRPGKDSQRTQVGSSTMGHRSGKGFTGVRELRILERPRRLSGNTCIFAEAWHVGETSVDVPFDGVLVSEVFRVAEGLDLQGDREQSLLRRRTWKPGAIATLSNFASFTREWGREHKGERPTPEATWRFLGVQREQIKELATGEDGILVYPRHVPFFRELLKLSRRR